jgi:hypothetical protein
MLEQVWPVLEVGQQQLTEGLVVLAALEDVLEVVHLEERELLLGQLHRVGFSHCKTRGQLFLISNCTACFLTVESSVADPCHFGVDPDPDTEPRIHASD